ncbi:CrcB family protein [Streptomyces sp. MJP52]|uniref:fluoride efflux transporter FluC n=1 Tax=Streptomyces sp. MJP52 TaxID=2940555 RepID=UPI002473D3E2|nr:CrcB family protein [Streptomyces sp. MJP52]MDH6228543.1 CrcB protein [Streptomyces sp. MJP52]
MNWLLVIAGALVGAPLRHLTDRAVRLRLGPDAVLPWGTFMVNAAGSLALGLLTGAAAAGAAGERLELLLGTGLCGALTTYSTFSWETLRLAEDGSPLLAACNVLGSLAAGLGAMYAGVALGGALWG